MEFCFLMLDFHGIEKPEFKVPGLSLKSDGPTTQPTTFEHEGMDPQHAQHKKNKVESERKNMG